MAKSRSKFIRDPIHGLVRFEANATDHLLLDLINCREFQRLRRIKQLGFSELVFPGASHSRFAHSIGVMCNAKRFLHRLTHLDSSLVNEQSELIVLVAALLHDLGHGPFSHAFEKITGDRHEKRTGEIILDDQTDVFKRLNEVDKSLPHLVASCFPEAAELVSSESEVEPPIPKILLDIISSQLDADRFDYLMRDSHASGTEYGRFDSEWLIDHLEIDAEHDRFFLSQKASHAAEDYVFARYHMYQSVYFHKATRSAEVMLRLLFQRCRSLLDGGDNTIFSEAPSILVRALSREELDLADYLHLDDHVITQFLKVIETCSDKTVSYLASGILNRRLYKSIEIPHNAGRLNPSVIGQLAVQVNDWLAKNADDVPVEINAAFEVDQPSDTPYKIYDPDSEQANTQIYVEQGDGKIQELSTTSNLVDAIKDKTTLLRYCYPREIRGSVDAIAGKLMKGK